MKLSAEIDGKQHAVEIRREGSKVMAKIDDRTYEIEASEPQPNVFLLKNDGRIFEATVTAGTDDSHVRIGLHDIGVKLIDPKRLRGSGAAADLGHGAAEIKTAMPGKVVRILAPAGTEVKKGEGIIVVEAMKMQNELKSPRDGVIVEVRFEEGSTVNAGEILVVIE